MKNILLSIFTILLLVSGTAQAQYTRSQATNRLVSLGMHDQLAKEVAGLASGLGVIPNNTYLRVRNAAGTANLSVLKSDASDNTVLNAGTGKTVGLAVNSVNQATFGTGTVAFPAASEEVVAGAGTTVADAGALSATKFIHQITGANGTVGWKFPASTVGSFQILLNTTAGVPKVYANTGGTCNGGSVDAACTLVTGIVAHICYATGTDTWICA